MRIAQICRLYLAVPPVDYGGTERTVAQMTTFLAATQGHDVTLYAASDSDIIAYAQNCIKQMELTSYLVEAEHLKIVNSDGRTGSIRLRGVGLAAFGFNDPADDVKHARLVDQLLYDDAKTPFDIVHCHAPQLMDKFIYASAVADKTLVHQHNLALDASYSDQPYPLICISASQGALMREKYGAKVHSIIYHGLEARSYQPTIEHAGFAAWVGRFSKEKGADYAIKIAREAGLPLVLAGTISEVDSDTQRHFDEDVKPYIATKDKSFLDRIKAMSCQEVRREIAIIAEKTGTASPVIFCGAANEDQKASLYKNAAVTLFPISWPEPFGLVMIESMAFGTPVVGFKSFAGTPCGAVAEVIDEAMTGFAISPQTEAQAVRQGAKAAKNALSLDRKLVRRAFELKWTSEKVAQQLTSAYILFLEAASKTHEPSHPAVEMNSYQARLRVP